MQVVNTKTQTNTLNKRNNSLLIQDDDEIGKIINKHSTVASVNIEHDMCLL